MIAVAADDVASAACQRQLDARYGASKIAVHVTPALDAEFLNCSSGFAGTRSCVGGTSGYPLAGGVEITSSLTDALGRHALCTSGYVFKANGVRYMLTAGHCGITAAVFTTPGYASGQNFGLEEKTNFGPYGSFPSSSPLGPKPGKSQNTGDLAFVRIYSGNQNASSPVILGGTCCALSPLPPRWKVKASWSNYKPTVGDRVCFSGAASGTQCGWKVEASWVKKKIQGKWLIGAVRVVRAKSLGCAREGDSGSPVFTVLNGGSIAQAGTNGVEAAGILSSGVLRSKDNMCVMWYSTIQNARRLMGSTNGYNDVVLAN